MSNEQQVIGIMALVGIMLLWILLQWQAQGAARLDDMVQDVTHALDYIRHHLQHDKIILGGYSSGGHVVATWLSRQRTPEAVAEWIQGILYISGVLSLDSPIMNAVTLSVFGKWASSIPSPYSNKVGTLTLPPPPANLPHLVIGCHQETFGIPLLDETFCAQAYVEHVLLQQGRRRAVSAAKCVLVDSNHWFILNSHALSVALQEHLPWLVQEKRPKMHPNLPPSLESTASSTTSQSSSDDLDGPGSSGEENETQ
jgi:acetyl esterase/lipase